ncbi:hypothetical protein BDV29DRAFT_19445 [Aspergillus leporis]|jgi:hypothetical protein|uniref:Uncharacterized protein n=1 Tax=Aspergillus leporis TaxID=41062 RepID=A0A5N5WS37_9EURO|nr:hypothetical protein BDV29DRAFT_19445 [Aspergillus leporis]
MVGIGGALPTSDTDIRLGDVVVSTPPGTVGGVVQYDLGKRLQNARFERTGQLNAPPQMLLGRAREMRWRYNNPKLPSPNT